MPLRLFLSLCIAALLLLPAVAGNGAPPDAARWKAVLAAGDRAEPVFDNAVAAFDNWLVGRGVPASARRRKSSGRPAE